MYEPFRPIYECSQLVLTDISLPVPDVLSNLRCNARFGKVWDEGAFNEKDISSRGLFLGLATLLQVSVWRSTTTMSCTTRCPR